MTTLIQQESAKAEKVFQIVKGEDGGLFALSPSNVAIVEAILKVTKQAKARKASSGEHRTEEAVKELEVFIKKNRRVKIWDKSNQATKEYKRIISKIVQTIDQLNSTHLNSDGVGREQIPDRIVDKYDCPKKLCEALRHPTTQGYELIKLIAAKTKPTESNKKPRANLSFATKFCHYLCFYLFKGQKAQDNFPIFDSVVKKYLPKYLEAYDIPWDEKIKFQNVENYLNYRKYIITLSGLNNISCNGLDHVIWFFYR